MVSPLTGGIGIAAALIIPALTLRDRLHVSNGLWWVPVAIGRGVNC
jgi:hypothetical protein